MVIAGGRSVGKSALAVRFLTRRWNLNFFLKFCCHPVSSKLWMLKVHWRVWAQPGAGLLQESGAGRAGGRPRGPWLALPGKAKVLDRQEIGRCKLPHFRLLDSPPATCFWSSTPSQVFFLFKELVSISEKFIWLKFLHRPFLAICAKNSMRNFLHLWEKIWFKFFLQIVHRYLLPPQS